MARTYGRVLCTIWQNADFIALAPEEKLVYLMVLSQPKLTLVGSLDLKMSRWEGFEVTKTHDLADALAGLERAQFVVIDWTTQELLVRSFTRRDPIKFPNSKLRKGLWGAWEAIESEHLKRVAVDNMPDDLFDYPADVPGDAQMCRSQRMEQVMDERMDSPMDEWNEQVMEPPPPLTATSPFDRRPAPAGYAADLEALRNRRDGINPQSAKTGTEW